MSQKTIIKNVQIVNEGKIFSSDILFHDGIIQKIDPVISLRERCGEINGEGLHLMPGVIDDQVHFREPGLTHKGDIFTESRAAVAGGITSFMEMPNTVPSALTQELLADKYVIGSKKSLANYSFFMGTSNDNLSELLKTNPRDVCGIKIFMGSSTGSMLVDNLNTLEAVFAQSPLLIATHCEDEQTIIDNVAAYKERYDDIPLKYHPLIRSAEACYKSSSYAVSLAKKYNTRLHILHISTAREVALFSNDIPLKEKRITAEACIHHLWFSEEDYEKKGNFIKWNPAIKTKADRDAILRAVLDNHIDVIATDHAPHTMEEKQQNYLKAPGGGPLVQHALIAMLEMYHQQKISLEKIAEKMSHAVADCFQIDNRGYIREGFAADLVVVNINKPQVITKESLLYKCKWSPFDGDTFQSSVISTFVNGNKVFDNNKIIEGTLGERLLFNRS